VPVHQIHRLARAVGGADRSQPAAGTLARVVSLPEATLLDSSAIIAVQ
jgi:hypothetical protein